MTVRREGTYDIPVLPDMRPGNNILPMTTGQYPCLIHRLRYLTLEQTGP